MKRYFLSIILSLWPLINLWATENICTSKSTDILIFNETNQWSNSFEKDKSSLSEDIKNFITQGIQNFSHNEYDDGYQALENALRMIRGNYGLYSSKQVNILGLIIEQTISSQNFDLFYDYQKIFTNLIQKSEEIFPKDKMALSITIAKSYLNLSFYDQQTAPYQNLLKADEVLKTAIESDRDYTCPNILVELLWLRSAVAYSIEEHFKSWKGEPVFGIIQEKIYNNNRVDPIEQLSRKNAILSFRKLANNYLEDAINISKDENNEKLLKISLQLKADWHLLHGNLNNFVKYRDSNKKIKHKITEQLKYFSYIELVDKFQQKIVNDYTQCEVIVRKNGLLKSSAPVQNTKKFRKIDKFMCRKLKTLVFREEERSDKPRIITIKFDNAMQTKGFDKPIFTWAVIESRKNIYPIWAKR